MSSAIVQKAMLHGLYSQNEKHTVLSVQEL